MHRRHFLAAGTATAFAGALPAQAPATATTQGDAAMKALMAAIYDEQLERNPQGATSLGLDTGDKAHLRGRLNDQSAAFRAGTAPVLRGWLTRLNAIPDSALSDEWRLHRAVVVYSLERSARGFERYTFGGSASAAYAPFSPYAVSQLSGAYYGVPDFLASAHPVRTGADGEAWLARLHGFVEALDANTASARADAARGIVLPGFAMDAAIGQLKALRQPAPADNTLAVKLGEKARAGGVAGDWRARAAIIVERYVYPALDRQIAALTDLRPRAPKEPGAWQLPDGERFYADALAFQTTTTLTPDAIHQTGLRQVRELHAQADPLLRAAGLTNGGVGERLAALGRRPDQLYPNTDAGREALLADLVRWNDAIRARMPEVFRTLPADAMEIVRVPPEIQDGAPGGYASAGSLDGKRPGRFYINLKDVHEWPKFSLPTLVYHEAIPGHLWMGAQFRALGELPMLRRGFGFAAYSEGWAHYTEQLADEMGMYADNPLARLGYLQALLFRASRLVVDTGMHAKRWTRAQATQRFMADIGDPPGKAQREIDRYAVWPGQACAYKIGHNEWVRLRKLAETRAGAAFDIKRFHDVMLKGSMPLAMLAQEVDRAFPA